MKQKLEGKISIFINSETTYIEIEDEKANTTFLRIKLTAEQLCSALSRQASIDCELEIAGLDRVGKKHEWKEFVFVIPEHLKSSSKSKELHELAQSLLTDGWMSDGYFSSQNSFFSKEGIYYARCVIRRYV